MAANPTTNPLNPFATISSTPNQIRVPQVPKLMELIKGQGFSAGIAQFDAGMAQWAQDLERLLNDRLRTTVPPSPVQ